MIEHHGHIVGQSALMTYIWSKYILNFRPSICLGFMACLVAAEAIYVWHPVVTMNEFLIPDTVLMHQR